MGRDGVAWIRARPHLVTAWAAVLLTVALGAFRLGTKSLWIDEALSAHVAGVDWSGFWDVAVSREAFWGLYYLAIRGWATVLGDSEVALRTFSLVAAIGAIPVTYLVAARLVGRRAAGFAAILLAVNGFFISRAAQDARGYALAVLFATLSSLLFVRAVQGPSLGGWVAYAAVGALAMYVHFYVSLVLLAHVVSLAFLPRARLPLKPVVLTFVAIGALISPLGLFILLRGTGPLGWIPEPALGDVARLFEDLSGDGGRLLLLATLVICSVGLIGAVRALDPRGDPEGRWRLGLVLAWLFVPVAVSFGFSVLARPILVDRYLIVCAPPLMMVAGLGLAHLGPGWIRGLALVILLVLAGRGLLGWYDGEPVENWRSATAYVMDRGAPGDGVVFYEPFSRLGFQYYLEANGGEREAPAPAFPSTAWGKNHLAEIPFASLEVPSAGTLDGYDRVWFVLRSARPVVPEKQRGIAFIHQALSRDYELAGSKEFPGVRIFRYEPG
jgi:mannosyltransferase